MYFCNVFKKQSQIVVALLILIGLAPFKLNARIDTNERHIRICMRIIGNEILLSTGDSTSRVMPIEKVEERYKIGFESKFRLNPLALASAINEVMLSEAIAEQYRVEVELCDSNVVVYGYELGVNDSVEQIACSKRLQPKKCYFIFITILDHPVPILNANTSSLKTDAFESKNMDNTGLFLWLMIGLIGAITIIYFILKNKDKNSHIIALGKYRFDQRKMILSLKGKQTELTSKEADLLVLLNQSINSTIERELILEKVWGDQGDYVGRTLDVFISKLRKKLEDDTAIKIVNIRGVGYKLVLDI